MYNNFNDGDNFQSRYYTRPKRKSKLLTYISLIVVTTLISTFATGGFLYSKFSNELKKAADQTALASETAKDALVSANAAKSNGSLNLTATALSKGAAVTEIAKKVGPSIVGIRMTVSSQRNSFYSLGTQESEGSGVIISKDGFIMTNYHVVQYADPKNGSSANTLLEVFLPDKRQAKARFVGGDAITDLAVVKIDLTDLPVAELGDSSKLEVGETAVAIGNPLGMEFAGSVTVGVVSALNRTIDNEALKLIQTDAAINPGNSGGALVNSQGQVIGINSAKISVTGVEGLGFAIPINDAKPVIDQLRLFGYVKGRPFIGISGQDITSTISQVYNLPVGIYITDVTAGSGADKAGIQKGDILTRMDGKAVKSVSDLDTIKLGHKAGDTVNVTVVRDGVQKSLKLTFGEER